MSDYVPPELIAKILLKLPTKSLIRFAAVCKLWRCIITSPSFISSYLYKPRNKILLRRRDERDKQVQYSLLDVAEHKPFTIISSSKLDLPFGPRLGNLDVVGSCRGIVCLSYQDPPDENLVPIVLWNPCLRKHLVLPKPTIDWEYQILLGFGVADDDFKVVRLVEFNRPEAEVFTLRTGRWRRLIADVSPQDMNPQWPQVLVNGAVHWLACCNYNKILVFRFAQEVFEEIKLPVSDDVDNEELFLTVIGESLAVVQFNEEFGVHSYHVWLMQEYGDESSWAKSYIFLVKSGEFIVAFRKNAEVLMATRRIGLLAFDLENEETKVLEVYGDDDDFYVDDYVESLHLLRGQSEITEE